MQKKKHGVDNEKNNIAYQLILAILLGLAGTLAANYPIRLEAGGGQVILISWGMLFPFFSTYLWGFFYGMASIFFGACFIYPFTNWPEFGYANLSQILLLFLWTGLHGWASDSRKRGPQVHNHPFFIQIIYSFAVFFSGITLFPALLSLNTGLEVQYITHLSPDQLIPHIIKNIVRDGLMLAVCDSLCLLPLLRRVFLRPSGRAAQNNAQIIAASALGGVSLTLILFWLYGNVTVDAQEIALNSSQLHSVAAVALLALPVFVVLGGFLSRLNEKKRLAEEAAGEYEMKYRKLLDNTNDFYAEMDTEGTLITLAPSVKKILGVDAGELTGRNLGLFLAEPAKGRSFIKNVEHLWEVKKVPFLFLDKSEKLRSMEVSGKLYTRPDGEKRILLFGQDQTDYLSAVRQMAESEKKYRLLYEKMVCGFILFKAVRSADGRLADIRFADINPGFEVQIGQTRNEVVDKTWEEVLEEVCPYLKIFERITKTGISEHHEIPSRSSDKFFMVNAFRIQPDVVGVICEDITAYRKAIEEINALNRNLERRVVERTSELSNALSELEAFTYTVSHDLKSPLRAILGYTDLILEDYGENLNEDCLQMLKNIVSLCRDMINLIARLLEYAMAGRTELKPADIPLGPLYEEVFKVLTAGGGKSPAQLLFEAPMPIVRGDPILIKDVVTNILHNAIKFSSTRPLPQIRVECREVNGEWVVETRDNGVGFDMAYAGNLFGICQRLHSPKDFEGSGVGLATVRKIIDKHGGKVAIEAQKDAGAVFTFTLPQSLGMAEKEEKNVQDYVG